MSIPVDSGRFTPTASGNFHPTKEWEKKADGSSMSTDRQALSDGGVPLWDVEILRTVNKFGKKESVSVPVTVPHMTTPHIEEFSKVKFEGLTVDFYVNKNGNLSERWTAEALVTSPSSVNAK